RPHAEDPETPRVYPDAGASVASGGASEKHSVPPLNRLRKPQDAPAHTLRGRARVVERPPQTHADETGAVGVLGSARLPSSQAMRFLSLSVRFMHISFVCMLAFFVCWLRRIPRGFVSKQERDRLR